MSQHRIPLPGCAPVPLAHYLKALGILRLVAEQADAAAAGCWQRDTFVIDSALDQDALLDFFLHRYQPTPIVVPWSGSDFFGVNWRVESGAFQQAFDKRPTSSRIIEAFLASGTPRLAHYRATLATVAAAMKTAEVGSKKDIEGSGADKRVNKARLLQALRNVLPDDSLTWLDSAVVVETGELAFNNVLGSGGGSDGNSHFSDNFMQALWITLPDFDFQRAKPIASASGKPFDSSAGLREAVFGSIENSSSIGSFSPVLFNSARVGGPNSTSGFSSGAASNPWDFILMIEGACLLAGAVSKKLESSDAGVARFPFLVEGTPVGSASAGNKDEGREVWLPMWDKATGLEEVRQIFAEARLESFGRVAKTGFDAFLALAQHGVDRGVRSFRRIGLVRGRVGGDNYFTSTDQGCFRVHQDKAVDLLADLEQWQTKLRDFARGDRCPAPVLEAVRNYEAKATRMAQRSGPAAVTAVLIALGQLELALAKSHK